jgi:anti-sigma factor RsiW
VTVPKRLVERTLSGALLIAGLAALAVVGWSWRPLPGGEAIQRALEARAILRQAQSVIPVTGIVEGRRYQAALGLAAGSPVTPPDLDQTGFKLTALRFGEGGAELFYQDRDSEMLTLCLHPPTGRPRLDRFQRGTLRLVLWQDEQIAMTVAADMPADRLQRLASLAYAGLRP